MTTEEIKQGKPLSPTAHKAANIASLRSNCDAVFIVWAWQKGPHVIKETLSAYMLLKREFGVHHLIFLQILQTVVPIIPGALTSIAVFIFTVDWIGNIYNYRYCD